MIPLEATSMMRTTGLKTAAIKAEITPMTTEMATTRTMMTVATLTVRTKMQTSMIEAMTTIMWAGVMNIWMILEVFAYFFIIH